MKSKKETFASLLETFRYNYDVRDVFNDLLTLSLCAFSQNPATGKSYDEDLYLETIAKYAKSELRHTIPKLLAVLIMEMEDGLESGAGPDVLGTYYELNLTKKGTGQFFTPWPICEFMASCVSRTTPKENGEPLRIIDPACGSGRMLLAGAKRNGKEQAYYGIDIDHTCVKMAVINLFLNGIFNAEVMCADALLPDDFRVSYVTSFLPLGIFKITEKEKSPLWHMYRNSFIPEEPGIKANSLVLPSEEGITEFIVSQLKLF